MKGSSAAFLTLTAVALGAATAPAQEGAGPLEQEAARQGWLFSLDEGFARARATGRPLLVVLRCAP